MLWAQLVLLYMKGDKTNLLKIRNLWRFSATRPLSATPRWEFVVHMNSTQVLLTDSTQVLHTNSTQVLHTNSTKVGHTNTT